MFKNIKNKNKGFTLIELIVVMAIFLFIIGAAIAIFISVVQSQRKILAEQELLNQMSYAEEYMSKALRMAGVDVYGDCLYDVTSADKDPHIGDTYLLTRYNTLLASYTGVKFINASNNNTCTEFFLDNEVNGDADTPLVIKELKNSDNVASAVALTSSSIQIKSIKFLVNGLEIPVEDEILQPRLTIVLQVVIPGDLEENVRTIQTTISQRNLNLK